MKQIPISKIDTSEIADIPFRGDIATLTFHPR